MEWNLKLFYENENEFNNDITKFKEKLEEITKLSGKLHEKNSLKSYIRLFEEAEMLISKLYVYVNSAKDLNQKDLKNQERYSQIYSLYNEYIIKTSFVSPELLSIGKEKLLSLLDEEDLKKMKYQVEKLYHNNLHVKDSNTENIMANYNEALGLFNKLYDDVCVVDYTGKDVKVSTGEKINVNHATYSYYLSTLKEQKDRKKVFESFYKYYYDHKSTLAGIYEGIMKAEMADVKNRGYKSILDSHLFGNNIDENVYLTLINTARNNNKPLKKYLKLRKELLNIKSYHTYDRFIDLVESKEEYPYDKAKKLVLEADKTMGEDFYKKACKVLEDGRVSVESRDGKYTGAYSNSTYNEGPIILLNHNNTLDSAFTIAHEAGHSIHTLYSNESQPYETANYTIFIAEIASTFNEQVFLDYMLKNTNDKNEKLVLLQNAIDGLIATFYRQTLFADYEYQAHKLVEDNKPVNDEVLSNIMIDLYKKYYGINIKPEKYKQYVWAYIPHFFHTPFYVYQYATSYSASMALYQDVKDKKEGAFDRYINLLRSGDSNYPVELAKEAGVDLTKKDTYLKVVNRLNELVDQFEKLIKE